mgnify:FL=1
MLYEVHDFMYGITLPASVFLSFFSLFLTSSLLDLHDISIHHTFTNPQDQNNLGHASALPPQVLHINPKHPIVQGLYSAKDGNAPLAALCAEQLMDNALVAAGLVDDVRMMVPRLNDIIASALEHGNK